MRERERERERGEKDWRREMEEEKGRVGKRGK